MLLNKKKISCCENVSWKSYSSGSYLTHHKSLCHVDLLVDTNIAKEIYFPEDGGS